MDLTFDFDPQDYTILVVDDNPTNLKVLVMYLKDYGFGLIMANDGESVWERLAVVQPDLILLDVMMPPGIDGFEVSRRLKTDPQTAHIPIIFMTALSSEEDKVKGFEVGAVDYVTKPLQQREVLARVTTHLQIQAQTKLLKAQARELTKLNTSKDKFFSIVAHDLKGPFMPLLGTSELMAEMAEMLQPTEVKELSLSINRAAKNVYNLLENLLQWSRLEQGHMPYKPETVSLYELAENNITLFTNTAKLKNIKLYSTVAADITVQADRNMLDTVIRNLISNALKFTASEGQVVISVNNSTEAFIEITIADTGVGMSEEIRQKLFRLEQHVTMLGTGEEEGTGLGLIICQDMVQKNGGRIWVESVVGQGTSVTFTVPRPQER